MRRETTQSKIKYIGLIVIFCGFFFVNLDGKDTGSSAWTIGEITWTGQEAFTETELNELLGVIKGQVYSRSQLENLTKYNAGSESQLQNLFMDHGYLFATVEIEELHSNNQISLELNVDLGPQVFIKNIYIRGVTPAQKKLVLEHISTKRDQYLSRKALLSDQDYLYKEGLVVANLEIDANQKTGKAVLVFELTERKKYPALLAGY